MNWLHSIAEVFREAKTRSTRFFRLAKDFWTIGKSGVFDSKWYLNHSPRLMSLGWNPLIHYLRIGASEGYDPNSLFDTSYYVDRNQDVAKAGINPLSHYIRRGAAEGRSPRQSCDLEWHLRSYGFDTEGTLNPLIPYLRKAWNSESGLSREFNPSPFLTTLAGLQNELAEQVRALTKTVTVVIPCHNDGPLLYELIDSLLKQLYSHLFVIVVDDGSTDQVTLSILKQVQSERVSVIRQESQGTAVARNKGAQVRESDYVLFLNPEDRLARETIALLLLELEAHPDVAYAYPETRAPSGQDAISDECIYNAYDILWKDTIRSCGLIRAAWYRNSSGFRTHKPSGHEDWGFALELSSNGGHGLSVPVPLFYPRSRGTNILSGPGNCKTPRDILTHLLRINDFAYSPEAIVRRKIQWRPTISVITVLCNRIDLFSSRLSSLWKQTVADFEVIVLNHGSDDPEVVSCLGSLRTDQQVKIIDRYHAGSASPGSNVFNAVRSDYICFLDGILSLEPLALESLSLLAALDPDRLFIHFDFSKNQSLEDLLRSPHLIRRDKYRDLRNEIEELSEYSERCEHQARHSSAEVEDSNRILPSLDSYLPITTEFSRLFRDVSNYPVEERHKAGMPSPFQPRYWRDNRFQILYCIPFCTVGGAEMVDLNILSALPKDRFRVTVVRMLRNEEQWLPKFRSVVDEVISMPDFSVNPSQVAALLRYLCVSRCIDLIFNRNTHQGYLLASEVRKLSSTVVSADLTHCHNTGDDWIGSSKQFHGLLDARFVVSSDLKQHASAAHGLPSDDFTVIHNGINTNRTLSDAQLERFSLLTRARLGIPKGAPVVGFVGRMATEKDLPRWMEVAHQIANDDPYVHFVMVGDGDARSEIEALINISPFKQRFHLTGYIENVDEIYAAMTVLLLTSKYEGLPVVFLEAMLQGVPVVSTRVGGVSECVTEKVGLLVDAGASANSIASQVSILLNRIEEDPGIRSRCRTRIQESFSIDQMQTEYVRKIEQLCSGRNRLRRLADYELWIMSNSTSSLFPGFPERISNEPRCPNETEEA